MANIPKKEFIRYFLKVTERVLEKELKPDKATEMEYIGKAYDILYMKIRHIKSGM